MIKNVDLLSYLPPFLQEYKEMAAIMNAESNELVIVWSGADRALKNEFIETADEYGIARFESILSILPYDGDTLETRRARVAARWFNTIPYTMKALIQRLTDFCGDADFTLTHNFDTGYKLELVVDLEDFGQVDELERLLETWLPLNIEYEALNQVPCTAEGYSYIAGGVVIADDFLITNDFNESVEVTAEAYAAGGIVTAEEFEVSSEQ